MQYAIDYVAVVATAQLARLVSARAARLIVSTAIVAGTVGFALVVGFLL